MKKVTIFQYRMFHYRKHLFELMRSKCLDLNIELNVVYGQPYRDEIKKNDTVTLEWGIEVHNFYFPIKEKKDLCWQPVPKSVRDSDLYVFMHENRLLTNYWWLLRRKFGFGPKVAFWGHGRDFQTNSHGGLREKWKSLTLRWPDWWFAYTEITLDIVSQSGFSPEKITVVNNAIDNEEFTTFLQEVNDSMLKSLCIETGFNKDDFVCIYCGSLYSDKRIDQLFEIAEQLQQARSNFKLLVIGDGALRETVEKFAMSHTWVSYLGSMSGLRKAVCFRLARLLFCPGAVGLNILDSFIAGTPLLTMRGAKHGPEVGFLNDGKNGCLIDDSIDAYVKKVITLMDNKLELENLKSGALSSAQEYSVDKMAERFVDGISCAIK